MDSSITQKHRNFVKTDQSQFQLQNNDTIPFSVALNTKQAIASSILRIASDPQKYVYCDSTKQKELFPSQYSKKPINIDKNDSESIFNLIHQKPGLDHQATVLDDSLNFSNDFSQVFGDKKSEKNKLKIVMLERNSNRQLQQCDTKQFHISPKAIKSKQTNQPMTTQPVSDSSSPGFYEPYFLNTNEQNFPANISSKQYSSCENLFHNSQEKLQNQEKNLTRFSSFAKSTSLNILAQQKINRPKIRQITAQIIPSSLLNKNDSDIEGISDEINSETHQCLSQIKQIKPKKLSKYKISLDKIQKTDKISQDHLINYLIPEKQIQSNIANQQFQIGSNVVISENLYTNSSYLFEKKMGKTEFLSYDQSSTEFKNDQQADLFEGFDSSMEKKQKQSIKQIVINKKQLYKLNQNTAVFEVKKPPLPQKVTQIKTKLGFQKKKTLKPKLKSSIQYLNIQSKPVQIKNSVQNRVLKEPKLINEQILLKNFDKKSQLQKNMIISYPMQNIKQSTSNNDVEDSFYSIIDQNIDKLEEPTEHQVHDFIDQNKYGYQQTPKFNEKRSVIQQSRKLSQMTQNSSQLEVQQQSSHSMDVKEENDTVKYWYSQNFKQNSHQIPKNSSCLVQMNEKFPIIQKNSKAVNFQICQQKSDPQFQFLKPRFSNLKKKLLGKKISSNSYLSDFKSIKQSSFVSTCQFQIFNKGNKMQEHRKAFYMKLDRDNFRKISKKDIGFECPNGQKNQFLDESLERRTVQSSMCRPQKKYLSQNSRKINKISDKLLFALNKKEDSSNII